MEGEDVALPEVLTVDECAAYLRISRDAVYDLLKSDELKGAKVGGTWRIHRSALYDILRISRPKPGADSDT